MSNLTPQDDNKPFGPPVGSSLSSDAWSTIKEPDGLSRCSSEWEAWAVVGAVTTGVLLAGALVAACNSAPEPQSRRPPPDTREVEKVSAVGVAGCRSAIHGEADRRWRERSTVVGNVGFYGPGRDFASAQRSGDSGDLVTKMPVIIEGDSGATIQVPREERDRVALVFGKIPGSEPYEISDGFARVRFEPCSNRARTGFVGGLVLRDRRTVALEVRLEGTEQVQTVILGGTPIP